MGIKGKALFLVRYRHSRQVPPPAEGILVLWKFTLVQGW